MKKTLPIIALLIIGLYLAYTGYLSGSVQNPHTLPLDHDKILIGID